MPAGFFGIDGSLYFPGYSIYNMCYQVVTGIVPGSFYDFPVYSLPHICLASTAPCNEEGDV